MTFSSIDYLLYLPTVVLVHYALPRRFRWVWLLAASIGFYLAWRVEYGLLLGVVVLLSYATAHPMAAAPTRRRRRQWLGVALGGNLAVLGGFKYLGFFGEIIDTVLAIGGVRADVSVATVLLPVGISFYTFQAIGYSIDVYRGTIVPERHLGMYALYISFFPQLVAGPVERARHLLPQLREPRGWDIERASSGVLRICWGLFKKLVIADRLAVYVDAAYADPASESGVTLLLVSYLFLYQLYCDFSAYSDIAVGSARILGVDLMENFRQPFMARTIGDFWRRWHISLTTWFRDYLYVPLARRRRFRAHPALDFLPLFVLIGLWHGPSWTFMAFGLVHAIAMAASVLTARHCTRARQLLRISRDNPLLAAGQILLTFNVLALSGVFFRSTTMSDAWMTLGRIVTLHDLPANPMLSVNEYGFRLVVVMIVVLELVHVVAESRVRNPLTGAPARSLRFVAMNVVVASTLMFGLLGQTEFVYFQF